METQRRGAQNTATLHCIPASYEVPVDRDSVRVYDLGNSGVVIDGIEPQNVGGATGLLRGLT